MRCSLVAILVLAATGSVAADEPYDLPTPVPIIAPARIEAGEIGITTFRRVLKRQTWEVVDFERQSVVIAEGRGEFTAAIATELWRPLRGAKFYDAVGKELAQDAVCRALEESTPVLVSRSGQKIGREYTSLCNESVITVIFPEDAKPKRKRPLADNAPQNLDLSIVPLPPAFATACVWDSGSGLGISRDRVHPVHVNGKVDLVSVRYPSNLEGVAFFDGKGTALSAADASKLLAGDGKIALFSADDRPVASTYRNLFRRSTVFIVGR